MDTRIRRLSPRVSIQSRAARAHPVLGMALGVPIFIVEGVFPASIRLAPRAGIDARQPEMDMIIARRGSGRALQPPNTLGLLSCRDISQPKVIGRVGDFGVSRERRQLPNRIGGVTRQEQEAAHVVTGLTRGTGLLSQLFKFPAGAVVLAQSEITNRELVARGVKARIDLESVLELNRCLFVKLSLHELVPSAQQGCSPV